MSLFNDDEQIVSNENATTGDEFKEGNAKLRIMNASKAPLQECNFRVLLELTGQGNFEHRPGLDLVTVLDVSGSMEGDGIEKLKKAMEFVVKKLSPIDRLSIITFAYIAKRLCPLRQINESSRVDITKLINNIDADGLTNITDGLQKALQVLDERKFKDGRSIGIMLMSDGEQNVGGDAKQLKVSNVPVYTFGFGSGAQDPKEMADVLTAIARNSNGGTFSDVQNTSDLGLAFASCLGGLLTVAVEDLRLTFAPETKSIIKNVSAGDYPQSGDIGNAGDSPVTVQFGNIYDKETRKVIVDLVLPEVPKKISTKVLRVIYKYRYKDGTELRCPPLSASVLRTENLKDEEEDEVIIEGSRVETAKMMKEARIMADNDNLKEAKKKLDKAQNMLGDLDVVAARLIEMLKREVGQLVEYLKNQDLYKNHGRSFALSSELSHDRQRFAARGDMENLSLFSTPRMDVYQEQAKTFIKDPTKPVPTVDDDQKQDIAAQDTLSPIREESLSPLLPPVPRPISQPNLRPADPPKLKVPKFLKYLYEKISKLLLYVCNRAPKAKLD